ncbi:uncharacterized protein ARMOST_15754 [Armillaria ostoyae]|uniref:F-box domain-containing protein n=1 Tax=Armillaria ostoyae TaxID=47428 RepID=A0A284RU94_ARMOS|nr:uncharacterized protein ARMOST_15754 [Armillaria ostoyae]
MVRLRGRRGSLKGMMNLPLDLWLEVFTYFKPQDLLVLARTSKDIRAFVLNQSQAGVWRRARKAESPPVPAPMAGLSEPAWISLLYDPYCGFCGAKDVRTIDFTFLARLCSSCKQTQLMTRDEIKQKYPGTEIFCDLCPSKTIAVKLSKQPSGGIRWQSEMNKTCYVLRDVIATKERWDALNEEERVLFKQERTSIKAMVSEILTCERWVKEKTAFRAKELEEMREERGKETRGKLEELGYSHEIGVLGDIFDQHHHVKRSKELTEKGWQNIRDDMIQWMEETRADYHAHVLAHRQNLAAGFFAAYARRPPGPQPYLSGFPSVQEFFCFSLVKDILDLPSHVHVDIQTFHDIIPAMPRVFQEFREMVAVHDHLLATIGPVNLCVDIFRKRAFLGLACNAFVCSPCHALQGTRILHYPEVLTHGCNAHSAQHQWGGRLSSPHRLRDLLRTFIRMVGLDPNTATADDMDRLPYFYRCKRCGGKNVSDWRYFVWFLFFGLPNKVTEAAPQIHHLYDYHKFLPVGEEEVQIINWGGLHSGDCLLFRITEQGPVSHVSP